jgi:hypothetical protein
MRLVFVELLFVRSEGEGAKKHMCGVYVPLSIAKLPFLFSAIADEVDIVTKHTIFSDDG